MKQIACIKPDQIAQDKLKSATKDEVPQLTNFKEPNYMNADPTLSNEATTKSAIDLSDEAWEEALLYRKYVNLPNTDFNRAYKWGGLKMLGVSDQECERLCRPIEYYRDEIMAEAAERMKKERRILKQINAENLTLRSEPKPRKHCLECEGDVTVLKVSGDEKGI